jgi:hypothetical protein
MDIQRFEMDSIKAGTTQNWIGHYYTTGPSSQVKIKSKLCYNNQTRYRQNGKLRICVDFWKLNATTKKDPYPLPFTDKMLNTIARY